MQGSDMLRAISSINADYSFLRRRSDQLTSRHFKREDSLCWVAAPESARHNCLYEASD
jgi:hypothetical protein